MKTRHERLDAFQQIDLYPVTDQAQSLGRSNDEVLSGIIAGGARIVQLREKELGKREFYEMACRFRAATERHGLLLIINDHLDVALACGADGVHLGQDDLPLSAARKIAPELLIGISTHSLDEARCAQSQGADYVNIGPIFPTSTKQVTIPPRTPQAIREAAPHLTIPFTVMGGINRSNIGQVLAAGARRIAVVTAVATAPDIAAAVRSLRETIGEYESSC
ncbi:MAG: thiamine phosphate synthase [Candidatus Edwardsbacteria bacterium]|nr:thiamine phosphate synthase [Candidatus Edwardsbacteria bacterium]